LGIGRVIRTGGGAEVAFEVVDAWQGRGIGRRLLTALRHRAAALGYSQIVAVALLALRRGRIEIAPADRGKVVLLSTGNWCAS
jgi:GNAT superfamily N-acetyltransferase